jgi:HK97 family phage major capsid protein
VNKKKISCILDWNLQHFAAAPATNPKAEPQIQVKELLTNIEKGVKESGTKIEGFEQTVNDVKKRIDELELKAQRPNTAPHIEVKDNYFEGQKMARIWKAQLMAQKEKKSFDNVLENMYGKKDKKFVEEVKELEKKAMSASGNAGIVINEAYFPEIIPLLYNKLAVMTLGARKVPMPNGNLTIRKMVQGTTGMWIGEDQSKNASIAKFAGMRLSSKKLTVKTPFSNDLLRSESFSADQMVRDDMVMQLQVAMDHAALYGTGTEYTPTGIANTPGINKVGASEMVDGDELYVDLIRPIKKANIQMAKPGWIFNPDVFTLLYNATFTNGFMYKYRDELLKGTFHGYPYIETNQIQTGTDAHGKADIFFGDFDKFFVGEQMDVEIKTSEDATYLDEHGNTRNAFDNDEQLVRALTILDMGAVYGSAFSVGTYYTK